MSFDGRPRKPVYSVGGNSTVPDIISSGCYSFAKPAVGRSKPPSKYQHQEVDVPGCFDVLRPKSTKIQKSLPSGSRRTRPSGQHQPRHRPDGLVLQTSASRPTRKSPSILQLRTTQKVREGPIHTAQARSASPAVHTPPKLARPLAQIVPQTAKNTGAPSTPRRGARAPSPAPVLLPQAPQPPTGADSAVPALKKKKKKVTELTTMSQSNAHVAVPSADSPNLRPKSPLTGNAAHEAKKGTQSDHVKRLKIPPAEARAPIRPNYVKDTPPTAEQLRYYRLRTPLRTPSPVRQLGGVHGHNEDGGVPAHFDHFGLPIQQYPAEMQPLPRHMQRAPSTQRELQDVHPHPHPHPQDYSAQQSYARDAQQPQMQQRLPQADIRRPPPQQRHIVSQLARYPTPPSGFQELPPNGRPLDQPTGYSAEYSDPQTVRARQQSRGPHPLQQSYTPPRGSPRLEQFGAESPYWNEAVAPLHKTVGNYVDAAIGAIGGMASSIFNKRGPEPTGPYASSIPLTPALGQVQDQHAGYFPPERQVQPTLSDLYGGPGDPYNYPPPPRQLHAVV